METIERFFRPPAGSFFLFGPRGTGKSSWLRAALPEAVVVDLLDPESYRAYLTAPERLRQLVDAAPAGAAVVIDEVQKVPALLDVVHQLLESGRRPRPRFILTGSSSRKLKRAGVDLMAGRLLVRTLHPFMGAELGRRFELKAALETGLLPLVRAAADPAQTLRAYAALYLKEEVQAEGLVRDLAGFSRFLEAMSFSHGSQLSLAEAARDCQVGRKTVEGYVDILEDLLLGFRLPVFARRAKRHLAAHPKFYFMDAGLYRLLRPAGPLDPAEGLAGAALEGLVAQHLRAWLAYGGGDETLHYWRTKSGVEVDFVVYGPGAFLALEVTASRRLSARDVRPLRTFLADYPQARACLLHGGGERLLLEGIPCLPVEGFLRELRPGAAPF